MTLNIVQHMELTLKNELQEFIDALMHTLREQKQEIDRLKNTGEQLPIPRIEHRAALKYPEIDNLDIGDSFFRPGEDITNRLRSIGAYHSARRGTHYTARTVIENGIKGARLWRTR